MRWPVKLLHEKCRKYLNTMLEPFRTACIIGGFKSLGTSAETLFAYSLRRL